MTEPERKFIGITKSTDPTQVRAPWRVAYEKNGKEYAYHETSKAKAINVAREKLGVDIDPVTLKPTKTTKEPWQMTQKEYLSMGLSYIIN